MLKNEIGHQAGTVWQLLKEQGDLSLREIGDLTQWKDLSIHLALGWLSRENKVRFFHKNEVLKVELNHSISENYY